MRYFPFAPLFFTLHTFLCVGCTLRVPVQVKEAEHTQHMKSYLSPFFRRLQIFDMCCFYMSAPTHSLQVSNCKELPSGEVVLEEVAASLTRLNTLHFGYWCSEKEKSSGITTHPETVTPLPGPKSYFNSFSSFTVREVWCVEENEVARRAYSERRESVRG